MGSDLIGRQAELAQIRELVSHGGSCAITGPLGAGKSHLAMFALQGRVHRVDAQQGQLRRTVEHTLEQRTDSTIILIDGLDDPTSTADCAGLLEHASGVVVTTRGRFPVWKNFELGPLAHEDALSLWRATVETVGVDEQHKGIDDVVEQLDRVPLAIVEVAAQRDMLGVATILAQLDSEPSALLSGTFARVQRALNRLSDLERAALVQSCAFRGWFDSIAASSVLDVDDPVTQLRVLIDHGLLNVRSTPTGRRARVPRIIKWVLGDSDQLDGALERHATYCVDRVEKGELPQQFSLDLLSASQFLLDQGEPAERLLTSVDVAALDARSTPEFLKLVSDSLASDSRFEVDLRVARATGLRRVARFDSAEAELSRAMALCTDEPPSARLGRVLSEFGALWLDRGEHRKAVDVLSSALEHFRAEEDDYGTILARRGEALQELDQFERALQDIERSYLLFRETGNVPREIGSLLNLGIIRLSLARIDSASAAFEEAEQRARAASLPYFAAYSMLGHALAAHSADRAEEACDLYQIADQALSAHGSPRDVGPCATYWALALHERGLLDDASLQVRRAKDLLMKSGFRRAEVVADATALGIEADLELHETANTRLDRLRQYLKHPTALGQFVRLRASHLESTHASFVTEVRTFEVLIAERILRRAKGKTALTVSADGREFSTKEATVSLSRRRALRLMLAELGRRRLEEPGSAMSIEELFAAGWPEARIGPEHASNRVYNALSELRSLGLAEFLMRRDDGYLLDPNVTFALREI